MAGISLAVQLMTAGSWLLLARAGQLRDGRPVRPAGIAGLQFPALTFGGSHRQV